MRIVYEIFFWIVAIAVVSLMITSFGYDLIQALALSITILPGAMTLRYLIPKVSFSDRKEGALNCCYIILGVLSGITLCSFVVNITICDIKREVPWIINYPFVDNEQKILINPLFIGIILTAGACANYLFGQYLDKKFADVPKSITFTSNYKKEKILIDQILYIESRDREVMLFVADGRQFRNATPISQWENMLGKDFIRIHRSFLVNKKAVSEINSDSLLVGETELPISRKYKDSVRSNMLVTASL